jgi:hypothetical protein
VGASHGANDLESEATFRSIQDNSAALRIQLDVGELRRRFSLYATAFGFHQSSIL